MQTFTPGGQGWLSLKKPSYAGEPLKLVVDVDPDHSGMYEDAWPAAEKSALLVKEPTSWLVADFEGKLPTVSDRNARLLQRLYASGGNISAIALSTAAPSPPWQLDRCLHWLHMLWVMSRKRSGGMPEHRAMDTRAPEEAPAILVVGVMMPSSANR